MLQSKLQTALKAVGVILIFCIVGVGILLLDRVLTPSKGRSDTFEEARRNLMAAEFDGEMYMRKNVVTYMIAGVDKKEGTPEYHRNRKHADFVMLVVVDKSDQKITAINVNRDTMVIMDMLGDNGWKTKSSDDLQPLTLAHTWGDGGRESADNLRRAVSRLFLGVTIDHYITLTMDSVGRLTDYINENASSNAQKVTVTFAEDADMTGLPEEWQAGTTVVVQGKDALALVRARDTQEDGSNADRMARQSMFIEALSNAIGANKWDRAYLVGAMKSIEDEMFTDHTNIDGLQYELQELFDAFGFYKRNKVIDLVPGVGASAYGHYGKFYSNSGEENDAFFIDTTEEKANLQKLVIDEFYRKIDKYE